MVDISQWVPPLSKFTIPQPEPRTRLGQIVRDELDIYTPIISGIDEMTGNVANWWKGMMGPPKPPGAKVAAPTPQDAATQLSAYQRPGATAAAPLPGRGPNPSITVDVPRNRAEDMPAPPAPAQVNFPAVPQLPMADYTQARQWMEMAQPKPEKFDPNTMLVSVLGGMAQGAAGGYDPRTERLGAMIARIGAGATSGYAKAKEQETEMNRRNEVARTGYALRRAGFEGDVSAREAEVRLKQAEMEWRRAMDIGKHVADTANQRQSQQYQHELAKWKLGVEHEEKYGPGAQISGKTAIIRKPQDGKLTYEFQNIGGTDLDELLKSLRVQKLLGEQGGGGGVGKGEPSYKITSDRSFALNEKMAAMGNTPMAQNVGYVTDRIMDGEFWKQNPHIKRIYDKILEQNKGLKNLSLVQDIPSAKTEDRQAFQSGLARAFFDWFHQNPNDALIILGANK